MIRSFRHKGLKLRFEDGSRRGVRAGHADRIELYRAVQIHATGEAVAE